jgi:hypothetical protein
VFGWQWSNRSITKMKMEEFGGAISDASKSIPAIKDWTRLWTTRLALTVSVLSSAHSQGYRARPHGHQGELQVCLISARPWLIADLSHRHLSQPFYRRALSQLAIVKPRPAIADLKTVLKLDPSNKEARKQLDATLKLVRKIEFEQAISVGDTESPSARCRRIIKDGSCSLDPSYAGPRPIAPKADGEDGENGRWTLTEDFIKEMVEWFRAGKALPKRIVWEIILAAQDVLKQESSLVEVDIEEGVHLDVMGDTHGQSSLAR